MKFNKKIFYPIILVVCFGAIFSLGLWIGATKINQYVPQPGTINFSLFWEAYKELKKTYVNPEKIDDEKILYGAIEGMTKSLGDPYTAFFNPIDAKRFEQDLSGSFEGIGAEIGVKNDQLQIIAPMKDAPSQKAGLKSGDLIVKIDGKDSLSMTTEEAVNLIRGPKGTIVTLTIAREGLVSTKDFKITRDTIVIPSMDWEIKNGDVAYIQIYQFGESLSIDFQRAALEILKGPAKKIVLDLRDNPGGYLEVSQYIAGWFLPDGQTVVIEDFGGREKQKVYKAEGNLMFSEYPIVVLINKGSASASEILAGALRDNRNIKLVGEKSYGKGSVQQVVDLSTSGSFLKVTVAKWLTPKGYSISEVGLTPDVKVSLTDKDIEQKKDPQLDKALELIK